jgi:hypothetical protein
MCPDLMFDFFSPIYLMRDSVARNSGRACPRISGCTRPCC